MGMLATVINALALQDALENVGVPDPRADRHRDAARSPSPTSAAAPCATWRRAASCIFAAGTGNPYFTTDTAAALRAIEIGADVILKATKVDGVYSADPDEGPHGRQVTTASPTWTSSRSSLKVMDATAISLCMDNHLPIIVFNLNVPGNIRQDRCGRAAGDPGHREVTAHGSRDRSRKPTTRCTRRTKS